MMHRRRPIREAGNDSRTMQQNLASYPSPPTGNVYNPGVVNDQQSNNNYPRNMDPTVLTQEPTPPFLSSGTPSAPHTLLIDNFNANLISPMPGTQSIAPTNSILQDPRQGYLQGVVGAPSTNSTSGSQSFTQPKTASLPRVRRIPNKLRPLASDMTSRSVNLPSSEQTVLPIITQQSQTNVNQSVFTSSGSYSTKQSVNSSMSQNFNIVDPSRVQAAHSAVQQPFLQNRNDDTFGSFTTQLQSNVPSVIKPSTSQPVSANSLPAPSEHNLNLDAPSGRLGEPQQNIVDLQSVSQGNRSLAPPPSLQEGKEENIACVPNRLPVSSRRMSNKAHHSEQVLHNIASDFHSNVMKQSEAQSMMPNSSAYAVDSYLSETQAAADPRQYDNQQSESKQFVTYQQVQKHTEQMRGYSGTYNVGTQYLQNESQNEVSYSQPLEAVGKNDFYQYTEPGVSTLSRGEDFLYYPNFQQDNISKTNAITTATMGQNFGKNISEPAQVSNNQGPNFQGEASHQMNQHPNVTLTTVENPSEISTEGVQNYYNRNVAEVANSLESVNISNDFEGSTWEKRNGEQSVRQSAVSFASDALDSISGTRPPVDSDLWSRASTWGSGYDDHPRSVLSSPPNELDEQNGAKSLERSNSFDGSSIVESFAPGSIDSESLGNIRFDERGSKAVSGRTTPLEERSISRNLSREPSFDRCSGEDASDVAPVPLSAISFRDGFDVRMSNMPVTDSTTSLVGSHSVLSLMTNDPPSTEAVKLADSRHTLVEESVGAERTDAEGSLDVNEVAWPKVPPQPPVTKNMDEADSASSGSFQQPRQAAYGQPSSLTQQARLSRPSSAASRPSPAPTPYAPSRSVELIPAVLRPNYPEGSIQEGAFSRDLPPSSQRMVPGMSGIELSQVPASIPAQISQRLEQPPEGAVEYVQDDRLPAQPDARTQNIRPSSAADVLLDSQLWQSDLDVVVNNPQGRQDIRSLHGPEGAATSPAVPLLGRNRSKQPPRNLPQKLGPHPDPEGVAYLNRSAQPSNYPLHSTPEQRYNGALPRTEDTPFNSSAIAGPSLPRGTAAYSNEQRRHQGSTPTRQLEDSARVVPGYETEHSISEDKNMSSQKIERPSRPQSTRSGMVGSEQDLSLRKERTEDRRSYEPEDRGSRRPRHDSQHGRYGDERYYRDSRRRYPDDSDEDSRYLPDDRRTHRRDMDRRVRPPIDHERSRYSERERMNDRRRDQGREEGRRYRDREPQYDPRYGYYREATRIPNQYANQYDYNFQYYSGWNPEMVRAWYNQNLAFQAMAARQNITPQSVVSPFPAPKEAESSSRTSAEDVSRREIMPSLVNSTQDISGTNVSEDRRMTTPHCRASVSQTTAILAVSGSRTLNLQPQVWLLDKELAEHSLPDFDTLHCFPGPLIRDGTMTIRLRSFCKDKISSLSGIRGGAMMESKILLWEFLHLLLKSNEQEYPENWKISRLLTGDEPEGIYPTEIDNRKSLDFNWFKWLIEAGKRQEALDYAIECSSWGDAYEVAFSMDEQAAKKVRKAYALSLSPSSFQTFSQLHSGRQPVACSILSNNQMIDWRKHLAVILSNPSRNPELDKTSIVAMGDSLEQRGDSYAAHFCYLVAGVEFGTPRMMLIGATREEMLNPSRLLEFIQMTEIYEYAMSLAFPNYSIRFLFAYKFKYTLALVTHGLYSAAYKYCQSIWSCLRTSYTRDDFQLARNILELGQKLMLLDPNTINEDGHRTYPDWITEASGIIWSFNVPQNEPCLSEAEINQTESTMSARTSNPMEPTLSSLEPISPVFDPASPVTDTPWEAQNTVPFSSLTEHPNVELNSPYADEIGFSSFNAQASTSSYPPPQETSTPNPDMGATPVQPVLEAPQLRNRRGNAKQPMSIQNKPPVKTIKDIIKSETDLEEEFLGYLSKTSHSFVKNNYNVGKTEKSVIFNGTYPIDLPITSRSRQPRTFPIDEPFSRNSLEDIPEREKAVVEEESNSCLPPETPSAKSGPEEQTDKASGLFSKFTSIFGGKKVPQAILPDDKKQKYVYDEAKKKWVNLENPDEETETRAPPPRSTFAGQPMAAQSVSKNPTASGAALRNKRVQSGTTQRNFRGPPQQRPFNFTPVAVPNQSNQENQG
ncbi:protein transport protein Sec16A-like isoform X2 [Artemia franciscana]|uniref:protein transport protein Sec16A-like isoform X2 n=1 Tax=Artemia franciscana TaxID=6661 RepID=UPI0032DB6246